MRTETLSLVAKREEREAKRSHPACVKAMSSGRSAQSVKHILPIKAKCNLWHELPSLAITLELLVRIPLKTHVSLFFTSAVLYVGNRPMTA
jgi:hypothetical protein